MNLLKALSVASTKTISSDRIQFFGIGDSITTGIGTDGTGGSYTGIIGTHTYLNSAVNLIANPNLTMERWGYPGETASWFSTNELANCIAAFNSANYQKIICAVFFGANEICVPEATSSTQNDYNNIVSLHTALRNAGAKTICVSILNRMDSFSLANGASDTKRLAINALLAANWNTFSDGFADLSKQPNIYASNAPNNDYYFNKSDADGLHKVHPTSNGAFLIAKEVAKAVLTLS